MSYFLSDRYETQDVLYETSHTRVVLVRALDTGDLHVIKGIRKDPTTPEHFFLEASLLQDLSHPGIPILLETEEDESYFYIVEEYIDSLDQYLLYHQNISQDTFLQFAMQLCEIIRYLHTHDPYPILHLDLKPDHIIVCGNQLKLIDFGNAKILTSSGNDFQNFWNKKICCTGAKAWWCGGSKNRYIRSGQNLFLYAFIFANAKTFAVPWTCHPDASL